MPFVCWELGRQRDCEPSALGRACSRLGDRACRVVSAALSSGMEAGRPGATGQMLRPRAGRHEPHLSGTSARILVCVLMSNHWQQLLYRETEGGADQPPTNACEVPCYRPACMCPARERQCVDRGITILGDTFMLRPCLIHVEREGAVGCSQGGLLWKKRQTALLSGSSSV